MAVMLPLVGTHVFDLNFRFKYGPFVSATINPSLTANMAYYVEIYTPESFTFVKIGWMNRASPSGNIDAGVYDAVTLAKIVSTGSTAQSGSNVLQSASVTQTTLSPGHYLLAISTSAGGSIIQGSQDASFPKVQSHTNGCYQEASAFPLPSTATPVTQTTYIMPMLLLIPTNF